jgi:hypothetical protein
MLPSLQQLFDHQVPNQIIWTADITYWLAGQPADLVCERGWDQEEGYLKLCQELGSMPYYWYDKFWAGNLTSEKVTSETEKIGKTTRKIWNTSVGVLVEETQFSHESHSEAITRYPIRDRDDLRILLHMLENSQGIPVNLDDYPQRLKTWAAFDGLPCLGLPRSPLSALFTEWTGVKNGVFFLLDEAELVRKILSEFDRLQQPILDAVCKLAPPLIHFADNLSSEVYTPFFDRYMAERYVHRIERLHASGICCAVHLDGTVKGLLPKLAEVRIDAVEALTPLPVGDVTVDQIRCLAGSSEVILWGGIPGAMFSPPFTWEEMRLQVNKTLEAWKGTRFILGTADQVPPDGDIEMVRRISELVAILNPFF